MVATRFDVGVKWQSGKSELIRLGGEAKVAEFHLNDVLESFKST